MRLRLVAVGQKMPAWVAEGWTTFATRLPRECPLELVELAAGTRARKSDPARARADEGERMLAALKDNPLVVALDVAGKAWDTPVLAQRLEAWRAGGRDVALLVGADAFTGLVSWHRWRELFDLAHLVVLQRPGHEAVQDAELAAETAARRTDAVAELHTTPAGRVLFWRVTQLEISSTDIRARVAAGRSIRYLVPDPVNEAIQRLGLYRAAEPAQARA